MRKLIAGMKISVDGKIAGPEGYADWVDAWADDYGLIPQIDVYSSPLRISRFVTTCPQSREVKTMKVVAALGALGLLLLATPTVPSAGPQPSPKGTGIYVADRLNGRIVYMKDMSGAGWATFGTAGKGAHQFDNPSAAFLDAAGRIYVADRGNNRIVRIDDLKGRGWTTLGSAGSGARQFNAPRGLFVDAEGRIYVADTGNHRIVRMDDMSGAGWTTLTQFEPTSVFVHAKGIYATWRSCAVVRVNDMTGAGLTRFGTCISGVDRGNFGSVGKRFGPVYGVFVDVAGRIYVAEGHWRIVRMDDMTSAGWTALGSEGNGPKQFNFPASIFLDSAGRIYVADSLNGRIVRVNDMSGAGWVMVGIPGSGAKQFSMPSFVFVRAAR